MTHPISQRCSSHNPYSPLLSWRYSDPDENDLGQPLIELLTRLHIMQMDIYWELKLNSQYL